MSVYVDDVAKEALTPDLLVLHTMFESLQPFIWDILYRN